MQEREAINEILVNINELPLDSSDIIEDINIAVIANTFLDISRKSVLSEAWVFNSLTISLIPNTLGYIVIPTSYLSVDGSSDTDTYTVRDHKLYDTLNQTFIFEDSVEVDIIEDIAFDDIPFSVANYIVKTATNNVYANTISDTAGMQVKASLVQQARIDALRDDANKIDGNVLNSLHSTNLLNRDSI